MVDVTKTPGEILVPVPAGDVDAPDLVTLLTEYAAAIDRASLMPPVTAGATLVIGADGGGKLYNFSGEATVSLPEVSELPSGVVVKLKAGSGNVTVSPFSGDTIASASTLVVKPFETAELYSNGVSNWSVVLISGLGSPDLPGNDCNNAAPGVTSVFGVLSLNTPPSASASAGIVLTADWNATTRIQRAYKHFPVAETNEVWMRVRRSGVWDVWTQIKAKPQDIPAQVVRAWVNFNGTGTVAIRSSLNVSSITDNGTGDYTVNFTSALPDADYAMAGATTQFSVSNTAAMSVAFHGNKDAGPTSKTTTQCRIKIAIGAGSNADVETVNAIFVR